MGRKGAVPDWKRGVHAWPQASNRLLPNIKLDQFRYLLVILVDVYIYQLFYICTCLEPWDILYASKMPYEIQDA